MGKPEKYVEKYLTEQARERGFCHFKFLSGDNGVPDRIIIGNGHTIFVEAKSDKGTISELQKRRIRHIIENGGEACVVSSRDEVDALFETITA